MKPSSIMHDGTQHRMIGPTVRVRDCARPGRFASALVLAALVGLVCPWSVQAQEQLTELEVPVIVMPEPIGDDIVPDAADISGLLAQSTGDGAAQRIGGIEIRGVQRIEPATVRAYLELGEGDLLDPATVNAALKRLFATGLFADIGIDVAGDTLIVNVVENPIINRIVFEGNKRIDDAVLEAELSLRPRVVYTLPRIQGDVRRLRDIYQRNGRFATRITPKVIQLEQNRVDLVFEIDEGPKTGIGRIEFIGNRFYSDSALRDVIQTTETRWYRFFGSGDTYDPDRLNFDRELLRRFYLANGFADFRVTSAVAELAEDQEDFFITFTLVEGERYEFGDFDIVSRIPDIDTAPLADLIIPDPGDWYDADALEDSVDDIRDAVGELGYAFALVRPIVDRDAETRRINISFDIQEGERTYVERIDINGNTRTVDEVIRREILVVEGDAFNVERLRQSRQNIANLGYFTAVDINSLPGSRPDSTVVEVDVVEQSTGELSIGAGYSTTDGALGEISLLERNFLGRGQTINLTTTLARRRSSIDLGLTEPYFMDRELAATINVFHVNTDNQSTASYDNRETGFGVILAYDLSQDWRQSLRYRLARESITNIKSGASLAIRSQEGDNTVSAIGQTLSFDTRDSLFDPTEGFIISLATDVAGLGGTVKYGRLVLSGSYHIPINEDYRLSIGGRAGAILDLFDKEIRINDRFFLGGRNFRGFKNSGVGPRDTGSGDALGGERVLDGSVELTFPLGLPDEYGLRGAVFSDFGTLWDAAGTNLPNIQDVNSLRVSLGVGLNWVSPFGPIRINFTEAVRKEDFDKTETFQFTFGTRF